MSSDPILIGNRKKHDIFFNHRLAVNKSSGLEINGCLENFFSASQKGLEHFFQFIKFIRILEFIATITSIVFCSIPAETLPHSSPRFAACFPFFVVMIITPLEAS